MTPRETAEAFCALLKAGKHTEAAERFNSPDILSLEAMEGPHAIAKGTEALKAKAAWWDANAIVHSESAEGPLVNGNQFIVLFRMDVTMKTSGERMQMEETGLYTVKDGKIIEERFFYPTA
jgi:limonene-1,2-epoxide hydrolase